MHNEKTIVKETIIKDGSLLVLRTPKVDDAKKMIRYINIIGGESNNLLFGKNDFHLSEDDEKEYIRTVGISSNSIMLIGIINDKIVSVSNISGNTRKRIAHNCELSISVKKEYWNLGIGTVVMEELIEFAKKKKIKNINLGVRKENYNAIKLYKKFGFEIIGVHKNYFCIDGIYYDEVLMDLNL